MGTKTSSENTHGKNSIEAAGDTAVEALHAVKDKLEDGDATSSQTRATSGKAVDDTKEFLREVSEQASDVAGTAANALGANIPEANKGEASGTLPKGSASTSASAKKAGKRTGRTAQDFVDEANQALNSLEARTKAGVQQAETSAQDGVSKAKQGLNSASAEARKEASSIRDKGHDFNNQAADRASRLGSAIREKVGKAKEQTEQVAHSLFPGFGGQKGSAADTASRKTADIQNHPSTQQAAKDADRAGSRWGQTAKDEASRASQSAKAAYHDGKGAVHSTYDDVTGAVASTYHDVKESARATVTDLEESAKSAMDRLRARLDADMEPHNFVDDRLSMGLIPSNTEEVLASRALTSRA